MNNLQQLMPGVSSEEIAQIAPSTSRLGEEKLGVAGVGSLIDLFRFRSLTNEANRGIAGRIALNLG